MESVLRRRILEALDEEQELENRQHEAEREKRYEAGQQAERELQERTIRALERVAIAFERISETLHAIRCEGLRR